MHHWSRIIALAPILATGCGQPASKAAIWIDDIGDKLAAPDVYRLRSEDRIQITVWSQERLSGERVVRPDGQVTLPLGGDVAVAGLALDAAASAIARRLNDIVREPQVTVTLMESRPARVSVLGEVRAPGQFPLTGGEGLLDVLARAQGLTEFADRDGGIVVLRTNPEPIRIRFSYEKLITGRGRGPSFRLRDGDVVLVE